MGKGGKWVNDVVYLSFANVLWVHVITVSNCGFSIPICVKDLFLSVTFA